MDEAPPSPFARVVGRVVDKTGEGIFGARLVAFRGVETELAWTCSDGTFDLLIESPTGVVRCLAWGDGHAIAVGEWLELRAGERIDVGTLVCGAAARISGRIVLPDGTKTSGRVSVEWTDAFDAETFALVRRCAELDRVDADYRCSGPQDFTISSLPPGRYRLRAVDGGEPQIVIAPSSDVVLAAPLPEPETVEPKPPEAQLLGPRDCIRGSVTSNGSPLTWVENRILRGNYTGTRVEIVVMNRDGSIAGRAGTAGDGSFLVGGLVPGTYEVWATEIHSGDPEYASARVVATTGESDVRIEMPGAQSRSFRLVLPDGFSRIDGHQCWISGPAHEIDVASLDLADGVLLASGMREHVPYSLVIRIRSSAVWTAPFRIDWFTEGDESAEIRLSSGLRIEGTVVRGDGSPVVGAYVYAENPDGSHADAYAGLDGAFVLRGLDPGRWTLEATAPGFAKHESQGDPGATGLRIVMQSER